MLHSPPPSASVILNFQSFGWFQSQHVEVNSHITTLIFTCRQRRVGPHDDGDETRPNGVFPFFFFVNARHINASHPSTTVRKMVDSIEKLDELRSGLAERNVSFWKRMKTKYTTRLNKNFKKLYKHGEEKDKGGVRGERRTLINSSWVSTLETHRRKNNPINRTYVFCYFSLFSPL